MRAFFALVLHEINERKALLVAAVVASLLPVLAPLLPSTGSNPAQDIREAVMWVMVLGLVPLFALLLGASFIGRDIAEGRLGFYFAQPMSGPAIWFGKLVAVYCLMLAVQAIIVLPTALLSGEPSRFLAPETSLAPFDPGWFASVPMWLGSLAALLLAHAVGIIWRSRSIWLVFDIVVLAMIVALARLAEAPFLRVFAADVVFAMFLFFVICAIVGLIVAGAVQLAVGRVDARRGHPALTGTLWAVMVAALLVSFWWSTWIRSAEPGDLRRVRQISVGAGEWIGVTGTSPWRLDYQPGFLINTADGRWLSAHAGTDIHERAVVFSSNMSRAAWTVPTNLDEQSLVFADLNEERLKSRSSGIVVTRDWRDLRLSADGERAVVVERETVMVYQLNSGALLGAAVIGGGYSPLWARFEGPKTVAILSWMREKVEGEPDQSRTRWREHRFDVARRQLDDGIDVPIPWWWRESIQEQRLEHSLVSFGDGQDARLHLVDRSNSELIADLGPMPTWSSIRVTVDGLIVILRSEVERHHAEVFSSEGQLMHRIDLPEAGWMRLGGEVALGKIVVGHVDWRTGDVAMATRRTSVVGVENGVVETELPRLSPALARWMPQTSAGAWDAASVASRLMIQEGGSLQLWDPDTGNLDQIIPTPD